MSEARRLSGGVAAHSMHRPQLSMGSFADADDSWVALNWGDPFSDPVWWIEWRPRGVVRELLDRLAEWRWQRARRRRSS